MSEASTHPQQRSTTYPTTNPILTDTSVDPFTPCTDKNMDLYRKDVVSTQGGIMDGGGKIMSRNPYLRSTDPYYPSHGTSRSNNNKSSTTQGVFPSLSDSFLCSETIPPPSSSTNSKSRTNPTSLKHDTKDNDNSRPYPTDSFDIKSTTVTMNHPTSILLQNASPPVHSQDDTPVHWNHATMPNIKGSHGDERRRNPPCDTDSHFHSKRNHCKNSNTMENRTTNPTSNIHPSHPIPTCQNQPPPKLIEEAIFEYCSYMDHTVNTSFSIESTELHQGKLLRTIMYELRLYSQSCSHQRQGGDRKDSNMEKENLHSMNRNQFVSFLYVPISIQGWKQCLKNSLGRVLLDACWILIQYQRRIRPMNPHTYHYSDTILEMIHDENEDDEGEEEEEDLMGVDDLSKLSLFDNTSWGGKTQQEKVVEEEEFVSTYQPSQQKHSKHSKGNHDNMEMIETALELLHVAFMTLEHPVLFALLQYRFFTSSPNSNHHAHKKNSKSHAHQKKEINHVKLIDALLHLLYPRENEIHATGNTKGGNPNSSRNRDHENRILCSASMSKTTNTQSNLLQSKMKYLSLSLLVRTLHCGEFLQRYCTSTLISLPTCGIDSALGNGMGGIISIQINFLRQCLYQLFELSMNAIIDALTMNRIDIHRDYCNNAHICMAYLAVILRTGIMDESLNTLPHDESFRQKVPILIQTLERVSDGIPIHSSTVDGHNYWTMAKEGIAIDALTLLVLMRWKMLHRLPYKESDADDKNTIPSTKVMAIFDFVTCVMKRNNRLNQEEGQLFSTAIMHFTALSLTQNAALIESSSNSPYSRVISSLLLFLSLTRQNNIEQFSDLRFPFILLFSLHIHTQGQCRTNLLEAVQDAEKQGWDPVGVLISLAVKSNFITGALSMRLLRTLLLEHPLNYTNDNLAIYTWWKIEGGDMIKALLSYCLHMVRIDSRCIMIADCDSTFSRPLIDTISLTVCIDTLQQVSKSDICCRTLMMMIASDGTDGIETLNSFLGTNKKCFVEGLQESVQLSDTMSLIHLANLLTAGEIVAKIITAVTTKDIHMNSNFKARSRRLLTATFISSEDEDAVSVSSSIDLAFSQSFSRDIIRRVLKLFAILIFLDSDNELFVATSMFTAASLHKKYSQQLLDSQHYVKKLTTNIVALQVERDNIARTFSTKMSNVELKIAKAVASAKADATELVHIHAAERRRADASLSDCKNQLMSSEHKVKELEEKVENALCIKQTLENDALKLSNTIQDLQVTVRSMELRQHELESRLIEKDRHIKELTSKIDNLNETSRSLESDKMSLSNRCINVEANVSNLEQSLEESYVQLISLAHIYKLKESALQKCEKDLEENRVSSEDSARMAHEKCTQLQTLIDTLQRKNMKLEKTISKMTEESTKRKPIGPVSYINSMYNDSTSDHRSKSVKDALSEKENFYNSRQQEYRNSFRINK